MFIHLEAEQINLHMKVDNCYHNDKKLLIDVYGFINLCVFIDEVQYFSLFDNRKCTLLIKDGEIINDKIK